MTRDEFFKKMDKLGRALEREDCWRDINEMCDAYYKLTRWNEKLRAELDRIREDGE